MRFPMKLFRDLVLVLFLVFLKTNESFHLSRTTIFYRTHLSRQNGAHIQPLMLTAQPQASSQSVTTPRSRYIPPEMDPEYRNMLVKPKKFDLNETALAREAEKKYPIPSEGDIVQFKGKFGSPAYGKLRLLQYVETYNTFFIDIAPLKPSKTPTVYVIDRDAKPLFLSINDVIPIKGYYSKRENGYRLAFENSTDANNYDAKVVPRASRYRILDKNYELKKKKVNLQVIEDDLKNYDDLKSRIATSSLRIGAVIALSIAFFLPNPDIILSYILGVLGGCLYFYLLSFKIDSISERYSILNSIKYTSLSSSRKVPSLTDPIIEFNSTMIQDLPNQLPLEKQIETYIKGRISSFRFLIPVILIMIMTLKNYYIDHDYQPEYFHFLPVNQFLSIMGGFLTLRISLFISEVVKEFRSDDIIEIIPGSVAVAIRSWFQRSKQQQMTDIIFPRKIVMVSGPIAAGRHQLIRNTISSLTSTPMTSASPSSFSYKSTGLNFVSFPLYTDDQITAQHDPKWYRYVNESMIQQWRKENQLFYEGRDRDSYGRSIQIFVKNEDLSPIIYQNSDEMIRIDKEEKIKNVFCLLGPPTLMEKIARLKTIDQQAIWVSMSSTERLEQSAKEMITHQSKVSDEGDIDGDRTEEKVLELLDEAKNDVRYYLEKSSIIPFVISNQPEKALDDPTEQLKQILKSIKTT